MNLSGKIALITGASGGIGTSIANRLSGMGMHLVITGRNVEKLEALKMELEKSDTKVHIVVADIALPDTPKQLIDETIRVFGKLDLLINNAGYAILKSLEETDVDDWDRSMAVNARAPFFMCREAIPYLQASSCGTIINISSVVGRLGYINQAVYTATKHALMGFSKVLAREVQSLGIRVHTIAPGGVATDMVKTTRSDLDVTQLIQPNEIADIVEFLLKHRGNGVIDNVNIRRSNSTPFV
ncbi:MAG TPA: SDR family oxidoreductase [Dysgonamonadaceae bacterium]|nr:SDR family oxidoreductase [Dysgonamonadaceae bacterium]